MPRVLQLRFVGCQEYCPTNGHLYAPDDHFCHSPQRVSSSFRIRHFWGETPAMAGLCRQLKMRRVD